MGCGCKYGCCGACSYGDCVWADCCVKPPPTCGCGEALTAGETCLNNTYYLYNPDYDTCSYYFYFKFGYVIFIPDEGDSQSVNNTIKGYMECYYNVSIYGLSGWKITTDTSDITDFDKYTEYTHCQNNAQNCFMWQAKVPQLMPFTPYGNTSCDVKYPSNYPCSSTP